MNAERLHAIATAVLEDFSQCGLPQLLSQLRDQLQNQVNQPQQPSHQQQVSNLRQQLTEKLRDAASNDFSPAWVQNLDEIGLGNLVGSRLLEQIDEIFMRNQITPSVAHQEIAKLAQAVEQSNSALSNLTSALTQLNVGVEELSPGTAELGVLVPRQAVSNRLDRFSAELGRLNQTFGTFAELSTGSRPGFALRTISSSDLTVFLNLHPEIAACTSIVVERIIALYKKLLEIRLLRKQLADQGVSDSSLQGVDSHANEHMANGITKLTDELFEKHGERHEEGRRNELRTDVTNALNQIANRIDRGYHIDIRVGPLEELTSEESETDERAALRDAIKTIRDNSERLQFLRPGGDPILTLPESTED